VRFVKSQHVRTEAAPEQAMYIGEFGVSAMNTNWDDTMERIKTVSATTDIHRYIPRETADISRVLPRL
jgi:hypothetical protein